MALRFPLAFALGLVIHMIAAVTTGYDEPIELLLQPIVGFILTSLALIALSIVGSPLLIAGVWKRWRRVGWLPMVLSAIGIVSVAAAWDPAFRIKALDPETNTMVDSFHPILSISGWLAAMFGVLFCPNLGSRDDRRWARPQATGCAK